MRFKTLDEYFEEACDFLDGKIDFSSTHGSYHPYVTNTSFMYSNLNYEIRKEHSTLTEFVYVFQMDNDNIWYEVPTTKVKTLTYYDIEDE